MQSKAPRLVALDALRGLTIAGMILVNYAGIFKGMYWPFRHAAWHGFTPTDLVFPSFLFIVGASMWYAHKSAQHRLTSALALKVVWRTIIIFLIGLLMNFPGYLINGNGLRLPGVLQRIALCYGVASFLALLLPVRRLLTISALILLGYWGLLLVFGQEDPLSLAGNAVRRMDLALLGPQHLYLHYGIPFDPEGLLSTLPALVNVIAGYLAGRLVDVAQDRERAMLTLFQWGIVLFFLGQMLSIWLPLNKSIWTSSYTIYTIGMDLILLAFMVWLSDVKQWARLATPFVIFGENPLFIYVVASLWESALLTIRLKTQLGTTQSLIYWLNDHLFAPWLGSVAGGATMALAHVLGFLGLAWALHRKRIIIKI